MKPRSRPQSCGLLRRKPDREVTHLKLEFQQLRKRYGQKEALRGVSITLSEGVYGLLGPNGAGKSTLMNILAGNLQADSGRILFCGEDIRRTGSDFPARLGYMPQQQTLYPGVHGGAVSVLHGVAARHEARRRCRAHRLGARAALAR